jgi:hypothetical protein
MKFLLFSFLFFLNQREALTDIVVNCDDGRQCSFLDEGESPTCKVLIIN